MTPLQPCFEKIAGEQLRSMKFRLVWQGILINCLVWILRCLGVVLIIHYNLHENARWLWFFGLFTFFTQTYPRVFFTDLMTPLMLQKSQTDNNHWKTWCLKPPKREKNGSKLGTDHRLVISPEFWEIPSSWLKCCGPPDLLPPSSCKGKRNIPQLLQVYPNKTSTDWT